MDHHGRSASRGGGGPRWGPVVLALSWLALGCQAERAAGPPAAAPGPPTVAVEIAVVNFAFQPKEVTVRVGTPVVWLQKSEGRHTVTAADGAFTSDELAPGQSYTFTPARAGRIVYYCKFHGDARGGDMAGVLNVRN